MEGLVNTILATPASVRLYDDEPSVKRELERDLERDLLRSKRDLL